MQKDLSPVINCLLCRRNWYSCCIIRSWLTVRFVSVLIHSYSHSKHILQSYVAATVQMHSDSVFSSTGSSRMKINSRQQMIVLYKPLSLWIQEPLNQPLLRRSIFVLLQHVSLATHMDRKTYPLRNVKNVEFKTMLESI